ncbi:MAG: beta-propeller fold lactonase family protein [Lachnospiraceae bacterium]|nr:beta-propeller fold lactonase family protein [Lachnospiraceae bacterium]
MSDKYVAYVGSYTYIGKSKGITIFDVDVEAGILEKKGEIPCNNSSFMAVSNSGKYLYSIIDEGLVSYEILPDGMLREMNKASIKGMRGNFIEIDPEDRYIFVAGYHDGKLTALRLNEDGTVGEITAGIFHKGLGTAWRKSGRPRVNCVRISPEGKFVLAADGGTDHIKIYDFNHNTGSLEQCDILRCELGSSPKRITFSNDGRFLYMVSEGMNFVAVYSYDGSGRRPVFKLLQKVPTCDKKDNSISSACSFMFSSDESHAFVSSEGDNGICIFDRDSETGLLTKRCVSPISGEFPKGICVFPDDRHICSVNNSSGTLTFFRIDYEKGMLIMSGRPVKVDEPNKCIMHKL